MFLMKVTAAVAAFVRPRWQAWLRSALAEIELEDNKFARALVGPDATDGDIPRGLVKKWLRGEVTVTPEGAYRAGQALSRLQLNHASGLLAVVAAGHFADFAKTIRVLATSQLGHQLSHPVVQYVPLVAEHTVAQAQGWGSVSPDRQSFMDHARYSLTAIHQAESFLEESWTSRNNERLHYSSRALKKAAPLIDLAIHIATANGLPRHFAWFESSGYLDIWRRAADFYVSDDEFSYQFLERGDGDLQAFITASARRYVQNEPPMICP